MKQITASIQELTVTEAEYIKDLETMIEVFFLFSTVKFQTFSQKRRFEKIENHETHGK